MRKNIVITLSIILLISSCGTYTGAGAYTGAAFGSVFGSAIGGLWGGPRGSDIGTITGMAGGAVIGGAIGNAADRKVQEGAIAHREAVKDQCAQQSNAEEGCQGGCNQSPATQKNSNYGSGLDETNGSDDRIYDFNGSDYSGSYTVQQPTTTVPELSSVEELTGGFSYSPSIEIRNARFIDNNQDNVISRGELCKVIFEVINKGPSVLYDVQPTVIEASGSGHIFISPGVHVEKINPGKGIRYTALVKADNRLKDSIAKICIFVLQDDKNKISKVSEFNIPTCSR